ncbi:MAG: hypothetical protein GY858_02090 [Candidatus Omnitrophica bacterium]|nr:hypothetical protein [Candidatus Omnitrophota bacterium]
MTERLETKLIKESWVKPNEFIKAKEEQQKSGKSLYSTLIRMNFMTEEDVYMFFAQHALIPFLRISDYELDPELLSFFPEALYRENYFLPIFKVENIMYVCMANPLDAGLVSTLTMQATDLEIYPVFGTPSAIQGAVNAFFGPDDKYFDLEDLIVSPQGLGLMPFWRESERLSIKLPVDFKPVDERVKLVSSSYVSATVLDISASGNALGIRTFIFLPPYSKVMIKFPSKDSSYEASAEVVRCNLERGGRYFLGVKFLEIREDIIKSILAEVKQVPDWKAEIDPPSDGPIGG